MVPELMPGVTPLSAVCGRRRSAAHARCAPGVHPLLRDVVLYPPFPGWLCLYPVARGATPRRSFAVRGARLPHPTHEEEL